MAAGAEGERFTDAAVAKLNAVIADAARTGERVAAWDSIKTELLNAKLGWYMHILAQHCGIHQEIEVPKELEGVRRTVTNVTF